jgi:hypothetical protein
MGGGVIMSAQAIAAQFGIELRSELGMEFPTLDQLMEPIDVNQVKQSFPNHQQKSSLSFSFMYPHQSINVYSYYSYIVTFHFFLYKYIIINLNTFVL